MNTPPTRLVPVHIGQPEPGSEWEANLLARRGRPLPVPGELDWHRHGFEPRWLGMETSDCAVAVQPSIFATSGADERGRFLAGTRTRQETAVAIVVIGDADDNGARSVLSPYDCSVHLDQEFTTVSGKRLPAGARPLIAPELTPADKDLALRLLNRPVDAPWWSLQLGAAQPVLRGGPDPVPQQPQGRLHPILVDSLGVAVVAVWVPPAGDQRCYIVPDLPGWDGVLDWLMRRALPEHAPGVLRRVRSPFFADLDLQTSEETAARQALQELETDYANERQRLEQELREAGSGAEPIRYGLLYEAGSKLVSAVAEVLAGRGAEHGRP